MRVLTAWFYSIVYVALLPWLMLRLVNSGEKQPLARFGRRLDPVAGAPIWLHASSVGEVALLEPLVQQIERGYPRVPIVISAYTVTGLATARRLFPAHRTLAFPVDVGWVVRRFIRLVSPRLIVIVEAEIWPGFFRAADKARIPLAVINGKMSERSFRWHRRLGRGFGALEQIAIFGLQSEEHRDRLARLNLASDRLHVTGNMKYDLISADVQDNFRESMRTRLGFEEEQFVIVGGSLHEPEDEALLDAYLSTRVALPHSKLIIVPRYPDSAGRTVTAAQRRGLAAILKTAADSTGVAAGAVADVVVVDTLGELRSIYAAGDVAFVGGSLYYRGANKGGHNLMEAAIYRVPVLFGPYNFSFSETVEGLLSAAGGIEVASAADLGEALIRLGTDSAARHAMGAQAREVVIRHQGATRANFELIRPLLAGRQH